MTTSFGISSDLVFKVTVINYFYGRNQANYTPKFAANVPNRILYSGYLMVYPIPSIIDSVQSPASSVTFTYGGSVLPGFIQYDAITNQLYVFGAVEDAGKYFINVTLDNTFN